METHKYLFEVSWEVCNKVGGIYTVISSKAPMAVGNLGENYYLLGPDLAANPEFEETDEECWDRIREGTAIKDIRCRFGRWRIPGEPKVILVGIGKKFDKDQLLFELWENYGVDSIAGGWDYVEPVMFSYTCGAVIETVFNLLVRPAGGAAVAQFHEWMCGAGLLFMKKRVPEVATVFTTHATILGRSLAGSGVDIYAKMSHISPKKEASEQNIMAKYSMEVAAAREADCFTTVSEMTDTEAKNFLGRHADVIATNGLCMEKIPNYSIQREVPQKYRERLMAFASRFLRKRFDLKTRVVLISGRYEFHNKGIDLFLEALGRIDKEMPKEDGPLLAFICVIGGHTAINPAALHDGPVDTGTPLIATHRLQNESADPILTACSRLGLKNGPENRVHVIFVPAYLNGHDGLINMDYYDVLAASDLGMFPSYYEPWGYTPLESIAYAVPTITTDQAGFGLWVRNRVGENRGVIILQRSGVPFQTIIENLVVVLKNFLSWSHEEMAQRRLEARRAAVQAGWIHFFDRYMEAYEKAMSAARVRAASAIEEDARGRKHVFAGTASMQPHFRSLTAVVDLPPAIHRLREMAYNLWWIWHPEVLGLFAHLDPKWWEASGGNPVRMLEGISQERLAEAAGHEGYLRLYESVAREFDDYQKGRGNGRSDVFPGIKWSSPVAYFSPEIGLHGSIPIYSGGLGVLAGDHLKAASDLNIPMVGVSLLYKNGYFRQRIDRDGWQLADYPDSDFSSMPVQMVQDEKGNDVQITVELPGRTLFANIWEVRIGRATLYLLDTDIQRNTVQDRKITSRLYIEDPRVRIEQEILLGIGGVKLLRKLGIRPSVYHINEGHSAFLIFERINSLMIDDGLTFDEAKEVVRSNTTFTTHTPVEAGNERFDKELVEHYFAGFIKRWGITWSQFWELGKKDGGEEKSFFMTILGLKLSEKKNAVSRVHEDVARRMWSGVWKGFHYSDIPIGHITNGVHTATYVAQEMRDVFDVYLGRGWEKKLADKEFWARIQTIPSALLWRVRSNLRFHLFNVIRETLNRQGLRYGESKSAREDLVSKINPAALVIGFARRFAPYKRAALLFSDPDRLAKIVNHDKRPLQILFAGKAHPSDGAGRELLREVIRFCDDPRFMGKIIFLEDYDLALAREIIKGVDVWLNLPRRPYEACGTSGQKIVINGGLNLSTSDGWWCEGHDGTNGWNVGPARTRFTGYDNDADADEQDAESLYSMLEDVVTPLFYERDSAGIPQEWVSMIKRSIMTIVPRFNAERMVMDYLQQMYLPAARRGQDMTDHSFRLARDLADWKLKVPLRFSSLRLIDVAFEGIHGDSLLVGKPFRVHVRVDPGKMEEDDILPELIIGKTEKQEFVGDPAIVQLRLTGRDGNIISFECDYHVPESGTYVYGIRIIPQNKNLTHAQDLGLVLWG
jgi:phosphorylase/glycogen(starch) synthase